MRDFEQKVGAKPILKTSPFKPALSWVSKAGLENVGPEISPWPHVGFERI